MRAFFLLAGALPLAVYAGDILKTDGFSICSNNSDIKVEKMNIEYNRATGKVTFNVAGTSARQQNVSAALTASAYGREIYRKEFNPCDPDAFVAQLCPVPAGSFAAQGEQSIPASYASQIPAIAFNVPDLDGGAKLELKSLESNQSLACIESVVNNGKTADVPEVKYVAAGIAAAALLLSGISALGSAAGAGAGTGATSAPSPTFFEVFSWFQSMAINGMLDVEYPTIYRSFTRNFAFAGGLIPWDDMQLAIDGFREKTGGNLTEDSVPFLRNATLIYTPNVVSNVAKRGLEMLFERQTSISVNGTTYGSSNQTEQEEKIMHYVSGIQAFAEQLQIPESNTFMTALLIFLIVIAAIVVGILLFKVILETWALFGTFPKRLTGFRKRYWWFMAKTIVNLILLVYGIWTLYCVYQFTRGDSWAAKVLAGVTLAIFTAILAFFTWRIWSLARKFKKTGGSTESLYDDKKVWRRYSIFYDSYKRGYWWLFAPTIVYMFVRGCIVAGASGHGLVQTAGQLIVESLMLILLLWSRPFSRRSGNWINIVIQVVRVLSVICILVFVQQLGISRTTKTITGLVLIVVQSVLTAILAILIGVNAIIICCKENPHRKQRKANEKYTPDGDNLTSLDARNSLLMEPTEYGGAAAGKNTRISISPLSQTHGYDRVPSTEHPSEQPQYTQQAHYTQQPYYPPPPPQSHRQPTLPAVSPP